MKLDPSARIFFFFFLGLPLVSCQSRGVKPDLNLVEGYSADLNRAEPFSAPPYFALYRKADKQLCFVAAAHQSADGPTEKTIKRIWQEFSPTSVILEGFESEKGPSPSLSKTR